ncbi:putative secreted protein [Wickerhamomyces ciferrii]|uniref:Secreted protein n=1 Tax=Wickerhamomyces ciferrii (strain ATCC 14091 / BCRC 22168 / CBS 111 / JCM 3599 / NBRC 0793 / NRRL Y-1031 F-60-10) TaxID=1206466 RepID=K0KH37_WICCF|nr:uncharacterized protein BN7_228 [Wickerhamomyces ciferrii]CCH40694.1 putative secreted protein [Wickerhamomyces ciferrii]
MKFTTILNTLFITSLVSAVDKPDGVTDRRAAPYQFVGNKEGSNLQWDLLIKDKHDATTFKLKPNSKVEGFQVTNIQTHPQLESLTPPGDLQYNEAWFKVPNNASFDGDGSDPSQIFTIIAQASGNQTEYNLSLHVVTDKEQFNVSQTLGGSGNYQ